MSDIALQLYNSAIKITECSAIQQKVFKAWQGLNSDKPEHALAFDTETTGLTINMPTRLKYKHSVIECANIFVFGISMCIPYKDKLALVWAYWDNPLYDECINLLKSKGPKVAHNIQYDEKVFKLMGIDIIGPKHCTKTQARIHWNERMNVDLKTLAPHVHADFDDYEAPLKAVLRNIKSAYTRAGYPKDYCNYSFIPNDIITEYAMKDAYLCWMLHQMLQPHIKAHHSMVYKREMGVLDEVIKTELHGLQFNRQEARKQIKLMYKDQEKYISEARKLVGDNTFNPSSPKQLLQAFKSKFKVPRKLLLVRRGRKFVESTDAEVLTRLAESTAVSRDVNTFAKVILNLRSCNKIVGTYLKPLYERARINNGTVYCDINPTNARTGRMSVSNPSLQNIPRPDSGTKKHNPVRKCFVCRKGYYNYYLDYSQMEMWLFAIHANEQIMLNALLNGEDVHEATARAMGGSLNNKNEIAKNIRQRYKKVNFGIIYGMGFKTLAKSLGVSEIEGYDLRKAYLAKFPGITQFMRKCSKQLNKHGYVEGLFGKRYNINPQKAYKAINALVQGDCAQILKIAILQCKQYLQTIDKHKRPNSLLYIHDETVWEMKKQYEDYHIEWLTNIVKCMQEIPSLMDIGIKLKVDVAKTTTSWEDKKDINIL